MNPKTAGLIRIFASLNASERQEAIAELNKYIQGDDVAKGQIITEARNSYVTKMDLGPVSSVCQYCGK